MYLYSGKICLFIFLPMHMYISLDCGSNLARNFNAIAEFISTNDMKKEQKTEQNIVEETRLTWLSWSIISIFAFLSDAHKNSIVDGI